MKGKKYRKWLEKHPDRSPRLSGQEKEFIKDLRTAAAAGLTKEQIRQRFIDAGYLVKDPIK